VAKVYKDHGISGAKGRNGRPAFDAMCRDATKRQFDVVMAWNVDRLGRSLKDLVAFLSELHALGIDLFLHQQGIDTTTPAGRAMFQMMGVFAEFERAIIIQERVRAGLKRARSEGQTLGRPPPDSARAGKANARGSKGAWAQRGRAQDRRAVWRCGRHSAADQPPFRGRSRKRRVRRSRSSAS
jgi:DNA invertase Pin-like site-specific DNA recombinase